MPGLLRKLYAISAFCQVFGEVGDIMKYVKTLRGEVRKLHATIRAVQSADASRAAASSAPPVMGEPDTNGNLRESSLVACACARLLSLFCFMWELAVNSIFAAH